MFYFLGRYITCEWKCEYLNITSIEEARKYVNQTWICGKECQYFNQPCNYECPSSRLSVCKGKCTFLRESFKKISLEGAIKCPNTCHIYLEYLSCNNVCMDSEYISDKDTWICNDICQSLAVPCNGKCPGNMNLNCQGKCEKFKKRTQYWCNGKCLSITVPCEGYCEEFEDEETEILAKDNCNGKCQSPLLPCEGVCPPDTYIDCRGFCIDYLFVSLNDKWLCEKDCINISSPCKGKCAHISQSISCNGLCETNRTAYMCGTDCLPINFPCEETCQAICNLDDDIGCSEQYVCEGRCQPMKLPCSHNCPTGYFKNCDELCETFTFPNYEHDYEKHYLVKDLADFDWHCDLSCIEGHCNSSCISGLQSCNGTCIYPTLKENCKGQCEIVPTFYNCGFYCQPVESPCNGICYEGFSLNFDGNCVFDNKTCELGFTFDCGTHVCTDMPVNIICKGKCQSITETCHGVCPLKQQILTCNLTCVFAIDHIEKSYHCNNQCIALREQCKGKCPPLTITCKEQCYTSNVVFECDGKCTSDQKECNDCQTAFVRHLEDTGKMTNCPNELYCTLPEKICNDFSSFYVEGCSMGSELSKRVCENPAKYNLSNVCNSRNLDSCSGHRPLQCIEPTRKCNNFIDCVDRSDESGCIFEPEKEIDYSIFKECQTSDYGFIIQTGFLCLNQCISDSIWCRNTNTKFEQNLLAKLSSCPKLHKVVNSEQLCRNHTFWSKKPCDNGFIRCSGYFPGQCFSKSICGFPVSI